MRANKISRLWFFCPRHCYYYYEFCQLIDKIEWQNPLCTQPNRQGLVGGHFVITICRQTVGFVEGRSSFIQPSGDRMQCFPTQSLRLERQSYIKLSE